MKVIYVIGFLIIYLEMIFKGIILKNFEINNVAYTMLFSVQVILILNLLCNIFKHKISKIILIVSSSILTIYFIIQAIFYNLFSIPFSFSTLGLAKGAFSFTEMVADAITENIAILIILLIPLFFTIIFIKKIKVEIYNKKEIIISIISIVIAICFGILIVNIDREGKYSAYSLSYEIDAQEKNIEKFGLIRSTVIDIKRTIFGFEENIFIETSNDIKEENEQSNDNTEEQEQQPEYNKIELQIDELINQTNDKNLQNIYKYIQSVEPSNKNEYTGYFKDKNLIFILAEGFNTIAVDENLTPTLYKLTNSGFVFNNFYSPVFLSTTGGEFQATTGLIPTQSILSIWKNNTPTIEYALGNSFSKVGYTANAYHNWTYNYYSREKTMRTLGFNSYMGMGNGLEKLMDRKWIPSDIDMVNVTTDFYTSEDKFVTYYVTVSGHAPYNFGGGNSTATRYREFVQNLPYDTSVKAYLASQIELDRALETLIQKLEEQGILDDTVIALVGDHYPYTLDINEINSVSKYKRDSIVEVNKSNFILWNSEMKEPIQINKVGSQIDVLPTLLNLFGIEYDSRLIIGQDILSEKEGIAIFSNRSWVSDYGTYFSSQNKFVPKENMIVEDGYIEKINDEVANKFTMSNLFIKYDIYNKLLNKKI